MKRIYRRPLLNVVVILGITLFFLFQIPHLELDNEVTNFVPEDDKELVALRAFNDQYGSAMVMDLVLTNPYGEILSPASLKANRRITESLEELATVEEVQSITNTDYISGTGGTLQVMYLSEDVDENPVSGAEIARRLNHWPLYDKMLVSQDGHSTQIGITMKEDLEVEEEEALYEEIQEIAKANLPEGFDYYLAGLPATTIQVSKNMRSDLQLLIPFVSLLVLLILYLSFRRLGGVLLPILNVAVSTIWTLGFMALTHHPVTLLGSIIPILMIAVGSAYGIHLVSHYFDEQCSLENPDRETMKAMVFNTLKVVGVPVAMAGLTTIAGFGALSISSVIPMRSFGIFTAIGVAVALVIALTLIPSLLLLIPGKASRSVRADRDTALMTALTSFTLNRWKLLLFLTLILLAGIAWNIPKVLVDNDLVLYFKEKTEVRQAEAFIKEHFAGTSSFNILINGPNKGSLNHPDALEFMDQYKEWILENYPEVSKVISYSDFIKRINQVLHVDAPGELSLQSPAVEQGGAPDSDAGTDFGFSDFADDSFGDSSFFSSDDSFTGGIDDNFSDTDVTKKTGPVSLTPSEVSAESSALMDVLWTAYLDDPDHFMESLARLTNYKGAGYYEVPADPAKYNLQTRDDLSDLVSQYLLLYSGSLDNWSNEALEPSQARISVQLNVNGTRFTEKIIPGLQEYTDRFLPDGYSVEYCGIALVQNSLTLRIVKSMIGSILLSIFLVFLILTFTYKSPAAGLIGTVPLSLTVLTNFGIMGLTGIRLDISTAMVGSIGIGIGIDYTIHYLSSYVHHFHPDRSLKEVTQKSMRSSGKPILFNALSVAAGFAVLLFSRFTPLMYFGLLIVITMAVSSLASLTVLPLMLNGLRPRFLYKNYKKSYKEGEKK